MAHLIESLSAPFDKPRQFLTESQKKAEKDWAVNSLLWYRAQCQPVIDAGHAHDLYDLAAGKVDPARFRHVLNPLNQDTPPNQPVDLPEVDILSPLFSRLMGMYVTRPFEPIVEARNPVRDARLERERQQAYLQMLRQEFAGMLQAQGQPTEDEEGNPVEPPELATLETKTHNQTLATAEQKALEYIVQNQGVLRKFRAVAYDLFVLGQGYTFRDIIDDEPVLLHAAADKLWAWDAGNADYLEDYEVVCYRNDYSASEIIDMFQGMDGFGEDEIRELETMGRTGFAGFRRSLSAAEVADHNPGAGRLHRLHVGLPAAVSRGNVYSVEHVQWMSAREAHYVRRYTETGVEEFWADDRFEPLPGDEVLTEFKKCRYEGYVIADKWAVGVGPCPTRRRTATNPYPTKADYNGRRFFGGRMGLGSLALKARPYFEAYVHVTFAMNKTIAKNRDRALLFPLGLIPKSLSADGLANPVKAIETWFYYLDALSVGFIDDSDPQALQALQYIKDVNLAMGNYIEFMMKYRQQIKEELEEVLGFNRYLMAATSPTDAVGNVQQGQFMGSLVTELYFTELEELLERDCQALADLSKTAWRTGKKLSYLRTDGERVALTVDEELLSSEQNVFIKNGGKTRQNRDLLKAQATQLFQASGQVGKIGKLLLGDGNIESILDEITRHETELERQQQQQFQQQMQQLDADRQQAQAQFEATMEFNYHKVDEPLRASMEETYALLEAKYPEMQADLEKLKVKAQEALQRAMEKAADRAEKARQADQSDRTKRYMADQQKDVQLAQVRAQVKKAATTSKK